MLIHFHKQATTTPRELCLNLGDAVRSSGADFGGIGFGDPVGEFDAFDDAWQLICAVEASPCP